MFLAWPSDPGPGPTKPAVYDGAPALSGPVMPWLTFEGPAPGRWTSGEGAGESKQADGLWVWCQAHWTKPDHWPWQVCTSQPDTAQSLWQLEKGQVSLAVCKQGRGGGEHACVCVCGGVILW